MCCGKDDLKLDRIGERSTDDGMDRREFLKKLGVEAGALAAGGLLLSKADYLGETALAQPPIFQVGDKLQYKGKFQSFLSGRAGETVVETIESPFGYTVKSVAPAPRGVSGGPYVTFATDDLLDYQQANPTTRQPADPLAEHIIDVGSRRIIKLGDLDVSKDKLGWGVLAPPSLKPGQQFPIMRQAFGIDPRTRAISVPFGRTTLQALPATFSIRTEAVQATITNFYDQARGFLLQQRAELKVLSESARNELGAHRFVVEIDALSLPGMSALAWGGPSSSVVVPAGLATPSMGIAPANHPPSWHGTKKCVRRCMALSWDSWILFLSALAICGALCITGTPAACVACLAVYVGWVIGVKYPQCKEHCGCPCS
jgi:hypothetical protein